MNVKNTYNVYFKRQLQLIGKQKLLKLKNSKVLVVGAGGLGSNVSHQLANNGVGTVGIMDGDLITPSNLHRQKNYCIKDINRKKTTTLSASIKKNNPYVKIMDYPFYLIADVQTSLFNKYHIIVDCTDHPDTKFSNQWICVFIIKSL
jgi:Dinucleotide-utilizing enzymes involved in molybdopterin and thiamine biosynthesis family 2